MDWLHRASKLIVAKSYDAAICSLYMAKSCSLLAAWPNTLMAMSAIMNGPNVENTSSEETGAGAHLLSTIRLMT